MTRTLAIAAVIMLAGPAQGCNIDGAVGMGPCGYLEQLMRAVSGPIPVQEPFDDLQKAADICAKHMIKRSCPDSGSGYCIEPAPEWASDCTVVTQALNARNEIKWHEEEIQREAAQREAEKPERDFVSKVAKGLKP